MKKYIVIIAAALVALVSCKDFLEEAPLTAQSDVLTLSTIEGFDSATGGAYAPLASADNWYGMIFVVGHELMTGNARKSLTADSGRLYTNYRINYSPTDTWGGLWSYAYYVISCCNEVINRLEGESAELGTEEERNNLIAEALFLRALSHFDLVRTFAQPYAYTSDASHLGVPIVLERDLSAKPARNTVKQVYEQVIADLTKAEGLIDPAYRRSGTDPAAAVSIYAIQGLLSRVYLYSKQWQLAADYATKVISSGKYSMWTADDIFSGSFEDGDANSVYWAESQSSGEVIFEIYADKSNSYDGYWTGIRQMTSPDGYGDAAASQDLIGIYEEGDVRGKLFFVGTGDYAGDVWPAKYYGKGKSNPDVNNVPIIRLSEMYLNRAEAVINGATGANAAADLEIIAKNRGASTQPTTNAGVQLERRKELAWEGHYWFDLARTGTAMTRTDVAEGVIKEIPYPNYRWAMPIPDRETIANENLEPNVWE